MAGKFIKRIYLTRERGATFKEGKRAHKVLFILNNFVLLLMKPPLWNICLFICFSFWCSVLFQSAEPGSAARTEQLTFTRRGNDRGCLRLDWCLCWSLYHSFLSFFFHSQFCSPGDHRKASPTLKLVLTLSPALIDFQGPAPVGLCKLGRSTDRLARRRGRPKPGGRGRMDAWKDG